MSSNQLKTLQCPLVLISRDAVTILLLVLWCVVGFVSVLVEIKAEYFRIISKTS